MILKVDLSTPTPAIPLRVVLDTNVWLDWLVFGDPGVVRLQTAVAAGKAQIYIDAHCAHELERVLGYSLGRTTLSSLERDACLAQCARLSRTVETKTFALLPRCRDPEDQKFLELAASCDADILLSKDKALLELARDARLAFRIMRPSDFSPAVATGD